MSPILVNSLGMLNFAPKLSERNLIPPSLNLTFVICVDHRGFEDKSANEPYAFKLMLPFSELISISLTFNKSCVPEIDVFK